MSLFWLVFSFIAYSAFAYWVVCAHGADRLTGWLSAFFVSFWAVNWDAEQIRFFVMFVWLIKFIVFVVRIFYLPLRASS